MILTVEEPEAVFQQALAAGATEIAPVADDHGWRIWRLADLFGHQWEVGKLLADAPQHVSPVCSNAENVGSGELLRSPLPVRLSVHEPKIGHSVFA